MSDFKAKMHQIRFWLRSLWPQHHWGSLQRSHRPPSWIYGSLFLRRGRRGRVGKGEWEGKEEEGRGGRREKSGKKRLC